MPQLDSHEDAIAIQNTNLSGICSHVVKYSSAYQKRLLFENHLVNRDSKATYKMDDLKPPII